MALWLPPQYEEAKKKYKYSVLKDDSLTPELTPEDYEVAQSSLQQGDRERDAKEQERLDNERRAIIANRPYEGKIVPMRPKLGGSNIEVKLLHPIDDAKWKAKKNEAGGSEYTVYYIWRKGLCEEL